MKNQVVIELTLGRDLKWWEPSIDCNLFIIKDKMLYLNTRKEKYGYVYLNTIYETFDLYWDTERNNICIENNAYLSSRTEVIISPRGFNVDEIKLIIETEY